MVQMGQVIGVFCYRFWDNGFQTEKGSISSLFWSKHTDVFNTLPNSGDNHTTLQPWQGSHFTSSPRKTCHLKGIFFSSAAQQPNETLDAFATCTCLCQLVKSCDYGERENKMIRDQLVDKCHSKNLKWRFLRETDLTLDNTLSIAQAIEALNHNVALTEAPDTTLVNLLWTHPACSNKFQVRASPKLLSNSDALRAPSSMPICFCWGPIRHKAKDPSCPAKNKSCFHCRKGRHFQRVCNVKHVLPAKREWHAGIRLVENKTHLPEDVNDDKYLCSTKFFWATHRFC